MPQTRPSKTKVISARSYVGVQVGAEVFNSLNVGKHGIIEMSLMSWGLHLKASQKGKELQYIVPYANLQSIQVEESKD